jgi:hypothetical protein
MWTAAPGIGQVFVQVAEGRHTSDLTFEERQNMSEDERAEWTFGSQMFLFGLVGYFFILWTLKFNMLCFYSRVVRNLWTERFVVPLMGFVGASAVAIIFTLALTCRPFQHLWQVWPDPGPQCVPQNRVFFTVILVFNLVTDFCIMLVPLPILIGVQINRLQKFGLYFLFGLGFFCMFAAILRYVLVFSMNQRGVSALWSLREDCVGIFVGQAPIIMPMMKRSFWINAGYGTGAGSKTPHSFSGAARTPGQSHELRSMPRRAGPSDPYHITAVGGSESQEEIVNKRQHVPGTPPDGSPPKSSGILIQQSIEIRETKGDGTYIGPRDPQW